MMTTITSSSPQIQSVRLGRLAGGASLLAGDGAMRLLFNTARSFRASSSGDGGGSRPLRLDILSLPI